MVLEVVVDKIRDDVIDEGMSCYNVSARATGARNSMSTIGLQQSPAVSLRLQTQVTCVMRAIWISETSSTQSKELIMFRLLWYFIALHDAMLICFPMPHHLSFCHCSRLAAFAHA
jgi:hypothetical protein